MICPSCANKSSRIRDSRKRGNEIRRRRKCLSCAYQWHTVEIDPMNYVDYEKEQFFTDDEMQEIIHENMVLNNVQKILISQTKKGLKKYGSTVNKEDYTYNGWLEHLQQELIDALVYSETLKQKECYSVIKSKKGIPTVIEIGEQRYQLQHPDQYKRG